MELISQLEIQCSANEIMLKQQKELHKTFKSLFYKERKKNREFRTKDYFKI